MPNLRGRSGALDAPAGAPMRLRLAHRRVRSSQWGRPRLLVLGPTPRSHEHAGSEGNPRSGDTRPGLRAMGRGRRARRGPKTYPPIGN